MGTSFFEQQNLSTPSLNSSRDNVYERRHDERFVERSSLQQQRRNKKRSTGKKERHSIIRSSLEQFLVDGQLEDFVDFDYKQQQTTQEPQTSNYFTTKLNDDGDSTIDADGSVDLFDRDALAAAGTSSRRPSRHRKKKGTRKSKRQSQEPQLDEQSLSDSKVFETSLSKPFDGHQSEGSLSLSDLKMDEPSTNEAPKRRRSSRFSRRSQESRQRPSTGTYSSQMRVGVRPRSQIGYGNHSDSALNKRKNNDLVRGLNSLDRQVRRDRMKKGYRTPSVGDIRSVGGSLSTTSTGSRSLSYKRTGFEGGALNAIMGNEGFAKIASNGGDIASLSESATFCTTRSDSAFLKQRRSAQDEILDLIARENSKKHDKGEQSQSKNFDLDGTSFSVDTGKKNKSIMKKMKKAARKTAKMSKSGARVAANAVMDSSKQRTARKGYKPAPDFLAKEEEKSLDMAKTPTHSNKKKARSTRSSTSKRPSKSRKGKETKPASVESFESSPSSRHTPKKAKKATESSTKGFTSFASFETASPFKPKHGKTTARATTRVKPKITTRGLNDSMSEMFPEFEVAENSTVVWWNL